MKKIALCLAILSLTLCSCGGKSNKNSSVAGDSSADGISSQVEASSSSQAGVSSFGQTSVSSSEQKTSSSSVHVHTPAAAVEENKTDATCTQAGSYDSVIYCSSCHQEISRERKTIPAKGHDLVHHAAQDPTCTEDGWEAYDTCSRCDYSTTKVTRSATGHHFVKNAQTLVYECDHPGCNVTNGRDYAINITYPVTQVRASNKYSDFAPTYTFVNDDHALDFGFYTLEILDENYNLLETIDKTTDGGNFKFNHEYVGKRIRILFYVVVLNGTNVRFNTSGDQITNLDYFCNGAQTERVSMLENNWYDGVSRKGYSTRVDLGFIRRSTNVADMGYTYQNKVFEFARVSSSISLSQEVLTAINEAYSDSECRIFNDNSIEFLSNRDYDGAQILDERVTRFGVVDFTDLLDGSTDDEFTLVGAFSFTKEIRNGVSKTIDQSIAIRRFVREDDTFRLLFKYGSLQFFLWFTPTNNTPVHFEEHTHNYVFNNETLEYTCDYKGCGHMKGRDYEMSITINPIHSGDLYVPRGFEYSFKNYDGALDFSHVTFTTEDNTFITPRFVGDNYHFDDALTGQEVYAHVYIAVLDGEYVVYSEGGTDITNCTVIVNGERVSCSDRMYDTNLANGSNTYLYHFQYHLGKILPYNGETLRISDDGKTATYGLYPQTHVSDSILVAHLNLIETADSNGWYFYDNHYYTKAKGSSGTEGRVFDDGTTVVSGETYWFECKPITWNVLSEDNGSYYLLSSELLDVEKYANNNNRYDSSHIRSWLNGDFYNSAFGLNDEKVLVTDVDNSAATTSDEDNKYACDNTQDKVFLPSFKDYRNTDYGFVKNNNASETRCCKTTDWALINHARSSGAGKYGEYWTRSPDSMMNNYVSYIGTNGSISERPVSSSFVSVRPAITVKL